jgi:hypothetical protein
LLSVTRMSPVAAAKATISLTEGVEQFGIGSE